MNQNKNILFYSNYCEHCKELLIKINNFKLKEDIQLNCVDTNRKNLPAFIKSVPTLVVPSENKVIVGDDVFKWVNTEVSKKSVKSNNVSNNQTDEILPWTNMEMSGGYSDGFSFLDSENTKEGCPMTHSFSFLNDSYSTSINTPSEGEKMSESNRSGVDQDYEALMKSRGDDTFNQGVTRI